VCIPLTTFQRLNQSLWKRSMYVMPPEVIPTTYFLIPTLQPLKLYCFIHSITDIYEIFHTCRIIYTNCSERKVCYYSFPKFLVCLYRRPSFVRRPKAHCLSVQVIILSGRPRGQEKLPKVKLHVTAHISLFLNLLENAPLTSTGNLKHYYGNRICYRLCNIAEGRSLRKVNATASHSGHHTPSPWPWRKKQRYY
jgi:hypothetical protein